jgi:hypothetical protein
VLRHSSGFSFRQDALEKIGVIPRGSMRVDLTAGSPPSSPNVKLADAFNKDDRSPTQSLDNIASPAAVGNVRDGSQEIWKLAAWCR